MTALAHSPVAGPGFRAWLIWGVGVAAYVISIANRTSLSAVGVDTAERFYVDASILALFAVIQLAVYGSLQIPIGLLLDRFGARPLMALGMLLMAVGQLTMAFSTDLTVALIARVLLGAGDAAIFPSVLRLVALWFPAQRGPMMSQLTGMLGQLGQILAIVPLAALLHATTWTVAFGSIAGIGILFTILVWLIIRNRPPELTEDVTINTDTGVVRVVTSSLDTGIGIRAAWAHPGTRLAFWSHFTAPFGGTTFVLLWGMPFLTAGEGLSTVEAASLLTLFVIGIISFGPVLGALSRRFPYQRTLGLVLPTIAFQFVTWMAVILWESPAPLWLLVLLMIALASGGPASMIAFDHARAHNPTHRLSTATGVVNAGGFVSALIAIFLVGVAMDLQGAGTPETYGPEAFRIAFLMQVPLWALGSGLILLERKRTRVLIGLDTRRR